ncbi:hypothetical protein HDV57DRAFT_492389 [Trichoderma longibrachiatum]|uniref:Uncharacterized protein n=1 Tax=Trichoderma longibrachiatum ATCC 18648 TaxID=983965 RepID=A0A2T4C2Z5_TRILO|nr:hypothetical protein M440DRAFT_332571 [Trichoderma longibrachiatum ATCC 18648]
MRLTRRSRAISYDRSLKRLPLRSRPLDPLPVLCGLLTSRVYSSFSPTTCSLCNSRFHPSAGPLSSSRNLAHTYHPHGSSVSSTELPYFVIVGIPKRTPPCVLCWPLDIGASSGESSSSMPLDFGCPQLRRAGSAPAGHDLHVKLVIRACEKLL